MSQESHWLIRDALTEYLDSADFLAYHTPCDGPLQNGTHPCTTCQGLAQDAIDAATEAGLTDVAKQWERRLERWRGIGWPRDAGE